MEGALFGISIMYRTCLAFKRQCQKSLVYWSPYLCLRLICQLETITPANKAAGVDEIQLEMLKVLDKAGVVWFKHLCSVAWRTASTITSTGRLGFWSLID